MKELEASAQAYIASKAGNCAEMAKVAFVHLARDFRVRPLELVYLKEKDAIQVRLTGTTDVEEAEPDHAFVIIGRKMSTAEKREHNEGYVNMPEYTSWDFGAAVCDPWAKRAYLAQNLGIEMAKINRVSAGSTDLCLEFRLEPDEVWPK